MLGIIYSYDLFIIVNLASRKIISTNRRSTFSIVSCLILDKKKYLFFNMMTYQYFNIRHVHVEPQHNDLVPL